MMSGDSLWDMLACKPGRPNSSMMDGHIRVLLAHGRASWVPLPAKWDIVPLWKESPSVTSGLILRDLCPAPPTRPTSPSWDCLPSTHWWDFTMTQSLLPPAHAEKTVFFGQDPSAFPWGVAAWCGTLTQLPFSLPLTTSAHLLQPQQLPHCSLQLYHRTFAPALPATWDPCSLAWFFLVFRLSPMSPP